MNKFFLSALITAVFLSTGFLLMHYGIVGYGNAVFVFLPFALGFILGEDGKKNWGMAGLIITIVSFFILLYLGGVEGIICVLMALPILGVLILLGVFARRLWDKHKPDQEKQNTPKVVIFPLVAIALFGMAENEWIKRNKTIHSISNEIILPYSALEVYDAIKSVDTLLGKKPFLMQLNLPIPLKCVLEEEKVGALRTCQFAEGNIVERITELEPGKILRMDVIDYEVLGRSWLGFKEAIYTFEDLPNGQSKMIRTTTYTSDLYPRVYWAPLERWGIEEEHGYVFLNLRRSLDE